MESNPLALKQEDNLDDIYLPDDAFQIAMVDPSPSPIKDSAPAPTSASDNDDELEDEPKEHGFHQPNTVDFGLQGHVTSVPLDLSVPSLSPHAHPAQDLWDHLSAKSQIGLFVGFDGPEIFPPISFELLPSISIHDTKVNKDNTSIFTVTLQYPYSQDVSVGFHYPNDVKLLGGTGVTNHTPEHHQGTLTIPQGSTSVSLIFELLNTSPLEPGDSFDVTLVEDDQGIVPLFLKPIGTSLLPTDETLIQATDDIFWTAHQAHQYYNLTFVIDISGSMNKGIETGNSRIASAQAALVDFIDLYDQASGHLHIHIVPFSSNPNEEGAFVYTASSTQDAKDFVLKQGAHSEDGLAIGMINPNTGEAMGRGTQYNDALYHTRLALEPDLINPNFADYAPKVYFFSDGRPNPGHGVLDNQTWPASWSPWPDFIQDTRHDIPNSFSDSIDSFAISLGLNPEIASSLQLVASTSENVFAIDDDFNQFYEALLQTVPEYFQGNLLSNDLQLNHHAQVTHILFACADPQEYLATHHLEHMGAVYEGQMVAIAVAPDGFTSFPTPLGGMLHMHPEGHFYYLPPQHETAHESFSYQAVDLNSHATYQANFDINTVSQANGYHNFIGADENNLFTNTDLSGLVLMQGNGGDNTFEVNVKAPTETLVIDDLFDNPNNVLRLVGLEPGQSLENVFSHVTQSGINASLHFNLQTEHHSMDLYLNNPGDFAALNLNDALNYLEQSVLIEFG